MPIDRVGKPYGPVLMRYSPANIPVLIVVCISIALTGPTLAEDRPGDEFRLAAEAYEYEAVDAVERAVEAEGEAIGQYMELATIFEEMAGIIRRAASLADVDQWDKISWEEYQTLEHRRDAILDELEGHHLRKTKQAQPDVEFIGAVREYR